MQPSSNTIFVAETRDDVPRQIDGVEFDVRQRVDQRDAAFLAHAAFGHVAGAFQLRAFGPRRAVAVPTESLTVSADQAAVPPGQHRRRW